MLRPLLMTLMLLGSTGAMASSPPASDADEVAVERLGVYVVAEDLDRAALFYGRLFGKQPQVRNEGMVGFDVAGGLYAIVSKKTYAPKSQRGDNAVPYIKVRDIFGLFQRVKELAPSNLRTDAVVGEGAFKFFRLVDPDGNLIEFFSVTPTRQ